MKPNSGLEAFVERNRADFDAFEPRLDLWDAIEARLDAPAEQEDETPTHVLPLHPPVSTTPEPKAAPGFGWQRYASAAAVALLLVAGGYGLRRADQTSPAGTELAANTPVQSTQNPIITTDPEILQTSGRAAERRLKMAVRRMEAYYGAQIAEKQHELSLVDASATPGTMPKAADWKVELASLDSTYRQLSSELHQNPDPNAVLDAMNQNLQIRLSILNQQLRTREQIRQYHDDAYILAADK